MIFLWTPKRKKIAIISSIVLATALASFLAIKIVAARTGTDQSKSDDQSIPVTTTEASTTSKLDGTETTSDLAARSPLAVVVENYPDARPQAGLAEASIVYEALTEGGITRFLAIYGPRDAAKIGPVRSARTYFVDWAEEYNALFAHAGGAQNALTKIVQDDVRDIPHNSSAYWRETSNVALEHTLFTSSTKLYQYAQNKGYDINDNNFDSWRFKAESGMAKEGNSTQEVGINFSDTSYQVAWRYNSQSNSYKREMAGSVHKDATTGNQIEAKNIILMTVSRSAVTSGGKAVNDMATIGSGEAVIIQDGSKITGTWRKTAGKSRTKFYNAQGEEIAFNAGSTWIEVISPDSVTFTVN